MDTSHRRRRTPWLPAMLTSLLLVLGSLAFAAPASADPSPQGKTAPGHAHKPAVKAHSTKSHSTQSHSTKSSSTGTHATAGSSGVSLPRPNDFQAQADPDGMTNGGVDQPGGQGGVDTTSQDGNNGSGNDADCEDDNRGVGVPGHCKDRAHEPAPGTPDVPGTDVPPAGSPVPTTPEEVLTVVPSTVDVSAPTVTPTVQPKAMTAVRSSAAHAAPATGPSVLPNTGAGRALLALAVAGLAALAVGGGLLRQGRRTATT